MGQNPEKIPGTFESIAGRSVTTGTPSGEIRAGFFVAPP